MSILEPILWLFFIVYISETYYLAVMSLYQAMREGKVDKGTMTYKVFFALWVAPGLALDYLVNLTLGTALFQELPQRRWELVTHRLKRHCGQDTWRGKMATWICHKMLDKFDPRGRHC